MGRCRRSFSSSLVVSFFGGLSLFFCCLRSEKLLALKFVVLFGLLFLLFDVPGLGVFEGVFGRFSLFYWNGSLHEWWFRSSLDHYATALGMLCAWHLKRAEALLGRLEAQVGARRTLAQAAVAALALAAGLVWMLHCLWLPKGAYNAQHPYTSIVPIVLYILLRNLTPWLRSHVLYLFTFFGKITLETYILQFHVWLSDDAATIVTYLPNYPLFNWILSTAIYVALSMIMFQSVYAHAHAHAHARTAQRRQAVQPTPTESCTRSLSLSFGVVAFCVCVESPMWCLTL